MDCDFFLHQIRTNLIRICARQTVLLRNCYLRSLLQTFVENTIVDSIILEIADIKIGLLVVTHEISFSLLTYSKLQSISKLLKFFKLYHGLEHLMFIMLLSKLITPFEGINRRNLQIFDALQQNNTTTGMSIYNFLNTLLICKIYWLTNTVLNSFICSKQPVQATLLLKEFLFHQILNVTKPSSLWYLKSESTYASHQQILTGKILVCKIVKSKRNIVHRHRHRYLQACAS